MHLYTLLRKCLFTALFLTGILNSVIVAQPTSIFDDEIFLAASDQDSVSEKQRTILLGLMDQSFQSMAEEGRRGRRIGGYVLLGMGIGSAVGGAATLAFGEGDEARIVGYSLLGGGALFSGLSLLPFKIKTEAERIYEEYGQMPAGTPQEIQQKYIYWDRRFGELAEKWRRERIIGGISSIVTTGATSIAIAHSTDADSPHAYIWPAVGGLIGGISSFLIESENERKYNIYRSAKQELLEQTSRAEVHFGVSPAPSGGLLTTVRVQF